MPKFVPIQKSFAAGEITERMIAQYDSEAYKAGVRRMENMVSWAQGPASSRGGFSLMAAFDGLNAAGFGFPVTRSLTYGVGISSDGNIYLSTFYRIICENDVTDWQFQNGSTSWTAVSSGDGGFLLFSYGACLMVPPTGATGTEELRSGAIALSYPNDVNRLEVYCDPFMSTAPMRVMVGTTAGTYDLYDSGFVDFPCLDVEFDPLGNANVYVTVIVQYTDGDPLLRRVHEIRLYKAAGNAAKTLAHTWTIDDLDQIQAGMPPGLDHMYFVHPTVAPQRLMYDRTTDAWTFGAIPLTSSPWSVGSYPSAICFFQGRCWMGGEPNNPESFWGSQSGIYNDFTLGTGLAAEAVSFTLATKGAIKWMAGAKNLLIGTEFGEHIITSDGGVITPSDVQADQQSAFGSASMQAAYIGTKVLYVSADGKKVRDMGYKWTDAGWVSRDITFTSEHITGELPVKKVVFSQNPDNLIVATTIDNRLITATYERTNDIVGWHRHTTTGRLLTVFNLPFEGRDIPCIITSRGFEAGTLHMEGWDTRHTLDHAFIQNLPVASTSVHSPYHTSQTVSVVVDGAMHPDIDLDANGDGTVNWACSKVVFGVSFQQYLKTLPLSEGISGVGNASAMKKRWAKIYLRLISSAFPLINGTRPPVRSPDTPMTVVEPLATEDVMVSNLGWDREGAIEIVQDLPLRTTIGGIFGEVAGEMLG